MHPPNKERELDDRTNAAALLMERNNPGNIGNIEYWSISPHTRPE
jgi:hypothetical protein